jgi:hypothetical protein
MESLEMRLFLAWHAAVDRANQARKDAAEAATAERQAWIAYRESESVVEKHGQQHRAKCEACGNNATHAPDPGNGGSDAFLCDECYTATPCECCACPPKACDCLGPIAASETGGAS